VVAGTFLTDAGTFILSVEETFFLLAEELIAETLFLLVEASEALLEAETSGELFFFFLFTCVSLLLAFALRFRFLPYILFRKVAKKKKFRKVAKKKKKIQKNENMPTFSQDHESFLQKEKKGNKRIDF
jgi:predicted membrane protein